MLVDQPSGSGSNLKVIGFSKTWVGRGKLIWIERKNYCFTSLSSPQLVQSLSCVQLFVTPWTAARQPSLSITNSQSLLKLMSMMPSNHLILCRTLFLLPSIFPSIKVFSSESVLQIRWPKYWSFSFSISPSNEYSGLISFRIDWFDLLTLSSPTKSKGATAQIFALLVPLNEHRKSYLLLHSPHKTGKVVGLWIIFGKVFSFSMIF